MLRGRDPFLQGILSRIPIVHVPKLYHICEYHRIAHQLTPAEQEIDIIREVSDTVHVIKVKGSSPVHVDSLVHRLSQKPGIPLNVGIKRSDRVSGNGELCLSMPSIDGPFAIDFFDLHRTGHSWTVQEGINFPLGNQKLNPVGKGCGFKHDVRVKMGMEKLHLLLTKRHGPACRFQARPKQTTGQSYHVILQAGYAAEDAFVRAKIEEKNTDP